MAKRTPKAKTNDGQRLVTRRLDEMTSREVELYLQAGGDLIFIPMGPVSGHGAFIPMGIHAHWAQALSLLVAEKANGLVYPPVYTCYSGATRSFRGACSFSIQDQSAILKTIVAIYKKQGFKRVVLVAGTTPENMAAQVAVREYFDETEDPVWMLLCEKLLDDPSVKSLYDGYPGNFGETLIEQASLKILGRWRQVPYPDWARAPKNDDPDQPREIKADIDSLRKWGAIGFRYHEEGQHGNHGNAGITYKGKDDIDLTVEVLERCADLVLPALEHYRHYHAWHQKHPFAYIVPTENLTQEPK